MSPTSSRILYLLIFLLSPLIANAYNEGEGIAFLESIRRFLIITAFVIAALIGLSFWKGDLRRSRNLPTTRRVVIVCLVVISTIIFGLIGLITYLINY